MTTDLIRDEERYHLLFGSTFQMVGTYHKPHCLARNTDLYKRLKSFNPDLILAEAPGYDNDGSKKDDNPRVAGSDLKTIRMYESNEDVELLNYDKDTKNTLPEYDRDVTDDFKKRMLNSSDGFETRNLIFSEYSNLYYDLFTDREEHAIYILLQELGEHDRILFHCGVNHLTSYKSFLDLISYLERSSENLTDP